MQKIAIVGAGIGGLATALSIPAARYQVDLFEQASRIRGHGSGLTLWPNATHILKCLGILEACEAQSGRLETLHIQLANGRSVMDIPTGNFPTPALAMHRADLHAHLLKGLSTQSIHLNHRCLGVHSTAAGSWLHFDTGLYGPYDLIVAADGIRSVLRRYVQPQLEPRPKGYCIWRGLAMAPDLFPAPGHFYEVWGHALRFGVLPLGQGRVCWYAARNQAPRDPRPLEAQHASLLEDFKPWAFPARELLSRTSLEHFVPADAVDVKLTPGWSRDRVLLLGDALHPMPANLGLGGNMALEDAVVLGTLLEQSDDFDQVVRHYEKLRFQRVKGVLYDTNFVGFFCQTANPLIASLRNLFCSVLPGRYFTWEARPLYGYAADRAAQLPEPARPKLLQTA